MQRQAAAGKTPAGMELVGEDSCKHSRILFHERADLVHSAGENPDAACLSLVADRRDYSERRCVKPVLAGKRRMLNGPDCIA